MKVFGGWGTSFGLLRSVDFGAVVLVSDGCVCGWRYSIWIWAIGVDGAVLFSGRSGKARVERIRKKKVGTVPTLQKDAGTITAAV